MPNQPSVGRLTMTISRLRNFLQQDAKVIIKTESLNHFKESFKNQGFTDDVLEPWPDIEEKTKKRKRRKNGNLPPILTDSGDLGNSITGTISGRSITFDSDLPYAARHNEGLDGMPKRQFVGPSKALERKIRQKLNQGIGRVLDKL